MELLFDNNILPSFYYKSYFRLSSSCDKLNGRNRKKVAILQSNYIPWKGYFDMINLVDEFIILDEIQYTRRDWRNRNKIKTQNGLLWILHCLTKKTLKWNGWIILDIKSISNSILLFSVESLYWIYFFGRGECKTIQEIF